MNLITTSNQKSGEQWQNEITEDLAKREGKVPLRVTPGLRTETISRMIVTGFGFHEEGRSAPEDELVKRGFAVVVSDSHGQRFHLCQQKLFGREVDFLVCGRVDLVDIMRGGDAVQREANEELVFHDYQLWFGRLVAYLRQNGLLQSEYLVSHGRQIAWKHTSLDPQEAGKYENFLIKVLELELPDAPIDWEKLLVKFVDDMPQLRIVRESHLDMHTKYERYGEFVGIYRGEIIAARHRHENPKL